jgi:hypothetical protein
VCFLLIAVLFTLCGAQTIALKKRPYSESFIGKPKVSGNLLVGLRFGEADGIFNPSAIGLNLTSKLGGHSVCVDISSRDGLYFAQNMYDLPASSGRIVPFETPTSFSSKLSQYRIGEMAVTVRMVGDCNSQNEGEIVPAVLSSSSDKPSRKPMLVALVNAEPDRLKLALFKNGAEVSAAECRSDPKAVKISFTSSCEFKGSADLPAGSYDLLIRLRERFALRDSHFTVLLP